MATPKSNVRNRLLIAAGALVAVVLAAVAIAWFVLDPGNMHKIVVTSTLAERASRHSFWQIAIQDDGSYTYSTDTLRRHGRLAYAPFAERFRSIAELRWDLPATTASKSGLYFWGVGTRRTVAPFAYGNGSDHPALRAFAAALHDAVVADLRRVDAPRRTALNGLEQLRSVEMRASGAMCGRCLWTMRIDASGIAHAHTDQPFGRPHALDHAASLRWREVVDAFRRAQLGELDDRYATSASDVAGVSFGFVFPHARYRIDAPDFQEWPRSLRRAFLDILAQLEHARWSPEIDPRSLPDTASMRAWARAAPI